MHLCRSINVPYASRPLQIFLPEKGYRAKRMITIRDRTHFPHAANVGCFAYVMNLTSPSYETLSFNSCWSKDTRSDGLLVLTSILIISFMKREKLVGRMESSAWLLFGYTFWERELSPALPNSSWALLWGMGNLFSILFHLCFPTLCAGPFPDTWMLLQYWNPSTVMTAGL